MKLLENSMLLVFLTSIVPVGLSVAAQPGTVVGWGELVTPYAITNAVAVSIKNGAAGGPNALALLDNGTVARWGNIQFGLATLPADLTNVIGVAAGALHSVVLRSDGTVVCWGRNLFGQSSPPYGLSNVVAVSAGFASSLALLADGTLRGWGDVGIPAGLSNVIAIASGVDNHLALKGDGTVVGWGGVNQFGQNNVPANLTGVVAIAAGKMQGLALKSDGTVVAWGNLGLGSPPSNLSKVTAIAAGFYQNCAIRSDHSLVAWGNFNVSRVLDIPAQLTNYTAIAASSDVNIALTLQPVIFAEPSGFALPAGADGTMRVDAVGSTPLQYQWHQNGQNLLGATNSTLTFTNLQAANAGDYYALISCSGGSVTSSVTSITVNPSGPTILMNPVSQAVLASSNVSFQVSAKGSEPLFYQWWFNGNVIPGATTVIFNLSNVTKSDGGQYYADDVPIRSEEHTSELQSHHDLVCRLLLEKKKNKNKI